MANKKAKARSRRRDRGSQVVLGQRNVLLLIAGLVVVTIGYLLLGKGSLTAAPVLLVVGYCVMIPLSIILWVRKPEDRQTRSGE